MGLMDKWAVHVGGGLTHRLSRADALMIKENDLSVIGSKDDIESVFHPQSPPLISRKVPDLS